MNRRNHSFVMESKLHDVKGRVDYISSPKRQENLYAVFSNVEDSYWKLLAEQNQRDFAKSGTEGTCIEARELIIMLPPSLIDYDHEILLKYITSKFLEKYDVGCCAALHHNKSKTNLHIHLIFSEREIWQEVERKIASRNMFYNKKGKHVRTKKEILDEGGNLRSGCKIIKKGEGAKPAATDMVKVHYRGTLIDGTEFDSSIKRGEPVEFPLNRVIPGWTTALQQMPVGSKWEIFIPSDQAYGPRGNGSIGPNETLIFEVELLDIVTPDAKEADQK